MCCCCGADILAAALHEARASCACEGSSTDEVTHVATSPPSIAIAQRNDLLRKVFVSLKARLDRWHLVPGRPWTTGSSSA